MSSSIVVITLAVFCAVVAGASDSWRPVAHGQKAAVPTPSAEEAQARSAGDADNRWWLPVSELRSLRSIYVDCISKNDDFGVACMKGKALVLLDRAMGKENIVLGEGVTLERSSEAAEKLITSEEQLEANLPREMSQREKRLDEMLFEHFVAFLQSHTVKLNLSSRALQDTFTEARKKGHKKHQPYMLFAMLTTGKLILAYSLKMIALIAGKALIIAKIALVLASVVGLKKLFHHEPEHSTHEVIAHEPYHHHYRRSFGGSQDAREEAAHKLAFNMQIPRPA